MRLPACVLFSAYCVLAASAAPGRVQPEIKVEPKYQTSSYPPFTLPPRPSTYPPYTTERPYTTYPPYTTERPHTTYPPHTTHGPTYPPSTDGSPPLLQCDVPGECQFGNLVGFSNEASQQACHEVCRAEFVCNYYTYNTDNSFCGLYTTCPNINANSCPTCISSQDLCPVPLLCNTPGTCLGTYLHDETQDSLGACDISCGSYPNCRFYTYDDSSSVCVYFATCPSQDVASCPDCVSGEPGCVGGGGGDDSVELRGGSGPHEGNVFVKVTPDSDFGQVCDDFWGLTNADVVCRQLGFSGAERATQQSEFGTGSNYFAMDDVVCSGSEARIQDCEYNEFDDCSGAELAGVVCTR